MKKTSRINYAELRKIKIRATISELKEMKNALGYLIRLNAYSRTVELSGNMEITFERVDKP